MAKSIKEGTTSSLDQTCKKTWIEHLGAQLTSNTERLNVKLTTDVNLTPGIKQSFDVKPYSFYKIYVEGKKCSQKGINLGIGTLDSRTLFIKENLFFGLETVFEYEFFNLKEKKVWIGLLFDKNSSAGSEFDLISFKFTEFKKEWDDPVNACLASIPSREDSLKLTVNSILPNVDFLYVYLNNYEHIPEFLNHTKITIARSQESGDRGDAGKFFWTDKINGYIFTCDDDLSYSPQYFSLLLYKVNLFRKKVMIGLHGTFINNKNFISYYASRTYIHFSSGLNKDTIVHLLGTGALCFHTSSLQVKPEDFKVPNMADVWLASLGQDQKIPFVCAERSKDMIIQNKIDLKDSIFYQSNAVQDKDCKMNTMTKQSMVVKENIPWKLFLPAI